MVSDQLWIISALIFGAALLGFRALYGVLFQSRAENKIINRRLALSRELSNPAEVLDVLRRERGLGSISGVASPEWLEKLVVQSGLNLSVGRVCLWAIGLTALFYLPLALRFELGPASILLAVPAVAATGYVLLRWARARRIAIFSEQLPEALDVVVRGLRAGHPFRSAVGLVARELPDPIGTEFGILLDEISFGLDQESAVAHLQARVGQDDLSFLAIAVNIQSQTGGNLAEVLQRLSRLLRNRAKMRLKIRALTSEGRLSGLFLSLMPFILFLIINLISPSYFGYLKGSPLVTPALVIGFTLMAIGNVMIYRMVNFRF
jgi:tight adherence protein B